MLNKIRKFNFAILLCASVSVAGFAQSPDDAQLYVAPGSTMEVSGNLTNDGGLIWNDGALTIQDSLLNYAGTVRGDGHYALGGNWINHDAFIANESSVRFTGTNATTVVTGGDTFNIIYFNKNNGTLVTLQGNLYVTDSLVWENENIVTSAGDTVFFLSATADALTGYSSSAYINGSLSRKLGNGSSYTYPVGSGTTAVTDYYPAQLQNVTVSGNPVVNARFTENFTGTKPLSVSGEGPYDSMATDGIWVVQPVSGTSGTETFTGAFGIENFTNLQDNKFGVLRRTVGSTAAADWAADGFMGGSNSNGRLASDADAMRYSLSGFDGEYGIGVSDSVIEVPGIAVDIKVFLRGPYSGSAMTTSIKSIMPLSQPYNSSPWNYNGNETASSIPSNAVDWVLVIARTGTAGSTAVDTVAGFLTSTGEIIAADGGQLRMYPSQSGPYYFVVKHRNHLAVMTPSAVSESNGLYTHDFTDGSAYGTDAQISFGNGKYGMYAGDVNSNGNVRYNGPANDRTAIYSTAGFSILSGYYKEDVNLNGNVRYNGPANDRTAIFNAVGFNIVTTKVPN